MRSQCSAISSTARNFLEAGARGSTRRCRYQPTHSRRHLQTQSPAQRSPLSSPLASTPSIPNLSQRTPLRSSPVLRTLNARRAFSTTPARHHGDLTPPKPGEERHVTFIDKEGHEHTFQVADGDNLLDIAQANDLEMEGACGGSCACSTCHVIVQDDGMYDKMVSYQKSYSNVRGGRLTTIEGGTFR